MCNDLGESDDRVERSAQFMVHIGQKLALRAVCHLGLTSGLDQFPLGCFEVRDIGINRDDGAVGHGAAADLQNASPRRHALLCRRHVAIKSLETFGDLGRRIVATEIPADRLKHQNVAKLRACREVRRQFEQFAETGVPCDQPPPAIKDAETLADVFERALKQSSFGAAPSPKKTWQEPDQSRHRCPTPVGPEINLLETMPDLETTIWRWLAARQLAAERKNFRAHRPPIATISRELQLIAGIRLISYYHPFGRGSSCCPTRKRLCLQPVRAFRAFQHCCDYRLTHSL